jgi:hypothetical protein
MGSVRRQDGVVGFERYGMEMEFRLSALLFVLTRHCLRRHSLLETYMYKKESILEIRYYTHYSEKIDMRNAAFYPLSQKSYRLVNETRKKRKPWSSPNADIPHKCVLFHNP